MTMVVNENLNELQKFKMIEFGCKMITISKNTSEFGFILCAKRQRVSGLLTGDMETTASAN